MHALTFTQLKVCNLFKKFFQTITSIQQAEEITQINMSYDEIP